VKAEGLLTFPLTTTEVGLMSLPPMVCVAKTKSPLFLAGDERGREGTAADLAHQQGAVKVPCKRSARVVVVVLDPEGHLAAVSRGNRAAWDVACPDGSKPIIELTK